MPCSIGRDLTFRCMDNCSAAAERRTHSGAPPTSTVRNIWARREEAAHRASFTVRRYPRVAWFDGSGLKVLLPVAKAPGAMLEALLDRADELRMLDTALSSEHKPRCALVQNHRDPFSIGCASAERRKRRPMVRIPAAPLESESARGGDRGSPARRRPAKKPTAVRQ